AGVELEGSEERLDPSCERKGRGDAPYLAGRFLPGVGTLPAGSPVGCRGFTGPGPPPLSIRLFGCGRMLAAVCRLSMTQPARRWLRQRRATAFGRSSPMPA